MQAKKGCTVSLNSVDVRAYVPKPGSDRPHAPNVKVDPMAKAITMEIFAKYPEKCFFPDGSLNKQGFLAAAQLHMGNSNQLGTKIRVIDNLKRR